MFTSTQCTQLALHRHDAPAAYAADDGERRHRASRPRGLVSVRKDHSRAVLGVPIADGRGMPHDEPPQEQYLQGLTLHKRVQG